MLQQTQVKTVIPYWERWMRELPTIESAAQASPAKLHKLWEGLGYYTRVRNLQRAARQIVATARRDEFHEAQIDKTVRDSSTASLQNSSARFPENFEDVLSLPGIGRYTAGAICSIAFNQPTPILDGNIIRVLTRVFGIATDPHEKQTNAKLWQLAAGLVVHASGISRRATERNPRAGTRTNDADEPLCSHLNQSLMELGALVCTPRAPRCDACPARKLCAAQRQGRQAELPNLGKRAAVTRRHFIAFVAEQRGRFLVRQRPAGIVNAHLWEFPNAEVNGEPISPERLCEQIIGRSPRALVKLPTVKHSITRYRITLEAWRARIGGPSSTRPVVPGRWLTPAQLQALAFTSAHRKFLTQLLAGQ